MRLKQALDPRHGLHQLLGTVLADHDVGKLRWARIAIRSRRPPRGVAGVLGVVLGVQKHPVAPNEINFQRIVVLVVRHGSVGTEEVRLGRFQFPATAVAGVLTVLMSQTTTFFSEPGHFYSLVVGVQIDC